MFKFGTKTSGHGMGWTDLSVYKQRLGLWTSQPSSKILNSKVTKISLLTFCVTSLLQFGILTWFLILWQITYLNSCTTFYIYLISILQNILSYVAVK